MSQTDGYGLGGIKPSSTAQSLPAKVQVALWALGERWDVTGLQSQFHGLGSRPQYPFGIFPHCHKGTGTFLSCWLCGSRGTVLQPLLATWGEFMTIASEHWSHQGQSFINSPPSFLLDSGDELKCSTPRAQRTGSTMRWKGVSTGSAGMLCPADGLVGDLLTMGPAPGGMSHPGLCLG